MKGNTNFFSTIFSSVPLKTILLWRLEVITLKLGHFDLPGSGCASRPSVNVKIDHVAGVWGGNPHVLPGVVATDDWRWGSPWVADSHRVCITVSKFPAQFVIECCSIRSSSRISYWTSYRKIVFKKELYYFRLLNVSQDVMNAQMVLNVWACHYIKEVQKKVSLEVVEEEAFSGII